MQARFEVSDLNLFTNILKAAAVVVDEASITASPDGLRLRSLDPGHVMLISLQLPNTFFTAYDVSEETIIQVNLSNLLKLLKKIDTTSAAFEASERRLSIVTENQQFTIPLLTPENTQPHLPQLSFTAGFSTHPKTLDKIIDVCAYFSDSVRITAAREKVELVAKSEYNGMASITLPKPDYLKNEPITSSYSLPYFSKIMDGVKSFGRVFIEFSDKRPAKFTVDIPDATLEFLLAPRLE